MKHYRLSGLIIASLLFGSLPTASALVTPGTKCSKAGLKQTYKGKIYTCVKLGAKLYWNNGTKVKTSSTPSTAAKTWKTDGAVFRNQILDIRNKLILSQEYKDSTLALQLCADFRNLLKKFPLDTPKMYMLTGADSNCPGVGFFNTAAEIMSDWASDRDVRNLPVCGAATFTYELIEFTLEDGGSLKVKVRNTSTEDVTIRLFDTNLRNQIRTGTFSTSISLKQGSEITTVIRSEESYNFKNDPFATNFGALSVSESKYGWFPKLEGIYYDLANPKYLSSCTSLSAKVESMKISSCPTGNIEVKVMSLTPGYLQSKYLNRWEYQLQFTNKTSAMVDILLPNDLVGGKKLDGSVIPSGVKAAYRYMTGNYYNESSSWTNEESHSNWLATLVPGGTEGAFATRMLLELFPKDANGRELTGISWNSFLNFDGVKAKPLGNYVSCDLIPVKLVN